MRPTCRRGLEQGPRKVTKKDVLNVFFNVLETLYDNVCEKEFMKQVWMVPVFQEFVKLYDMYMNFLRQKNGKLSEFWMAYIDIMEILFGLLRAFREGNWELYKLRTIFFCVLLRNVLYRRRLSRRIISVQIGQDTQTARETKRFNLTRSNE